jgi:hypothetical protein
MEIYGGPILRHHTKVETQLFQHFAGFHKFVCCHKLSLLPSKFTVVGHSANQYPKKVSRQLKQYWRTCSIGVKSDSGVKSDANTLYMELSGQPLQCAKRVYQPLPLIHRALEETSG